MTSEPPARNRQNSFNKPGSSQRSASRPPSTPARPAPHLALGAEGENRAARYFEAQGYRIVARNVRAAGVEVDLIVRRRRTLVFVEVKTRRSRRFGPPELAVTAAKRARLVVAATAWLRENGRGFANARFDVIAWQVEDGGAGKAEWRLRHIEDAFTTNE
ncbi:MAG: YraN family protein [Myxococcota bacterium]|nr:YraN family protein [Myxococcota bacterium]